MRRTHDPPLNGVASRGMVSEPFFIISSTLNDIFRGPYIGLLHLSVT